MSKIPTEEDVKFILNNYRTMTNKEMYMSRGLKLYKITNILTENKIKRTKFEKKVFGHGVNPSFKGSANGMYGKKHKEESKIRMREPLTPEQMKRAIDTRKRNGQTDVKKGLSYEEFYGEDRAKELKEKIRKNIILSWDDKKRKDFGIRRRELILNGKIKTIFKEGRENPMYVHGNSKEPYTTKFTKSLKYKIRKDFDFRCAICNLREEDNVRNLSIHHINYNKKDCRFNNLLPLCSVCHGRTNNKREYWENICFLVSYDNSNYISIDKSCLLIDKEENLRIIKDVLKVVSPFSRFLEKD